MLAEAVERLDEVKNLRGQPDQWLDGNSYPPSAGSEAVFRGFNRKHRRFDAWPRDRRTRSVSAAEALGTIHTPEALQALSAADPMAANGVGKAVVDARLACAEALLAAGKRTDEATQQMIVALLADNDPEMRAIVAVCTQSAGKKTSADMFLAAFKAAGDADRESLLPSLGRIGGPGAMGIVDSLINDPDAAKRQFGLKAITRWPDATVAPRLLDLLAKATDQGERDMLLGALIRIAPLPDNKLNDKQKLELLEKTMKLCQKDEDRARVLERANAIRTVETFRFVLPYLGNPVLAEPACKSVGP